MSTPGSKFYAVNDRPVAVVPTTDGGTDCVVFDFATGELVPDRSYFEYLAPGSGKDVDALTEAGFEARLASYRTAAGVHAVAQMRTWAEQLCTTTGGPTQVAAALGFQGILERDEIAVDPPPPGYAGLEIGRVMTTGASVTLRSANRLLTRQALDAGFGAGRDMPRVHPDRLQNVAYDVAVEGAPARCTIFAGFERPDAPAQEIMLRRDSNAWTRGHP
jgi:hypothetical protein